MLISFLKVTLRNLYREKIYALINISGLSLAIACCLILGLYVRSELTYDRHNKNYKQIFRIIFTIGVGNDPSVHSAMGPALARDFPEIKGFVRFSYFQGEEDTLIRHGDRAFKWKSIWYADNTVFDIFTHDIIYGDPKTALVDPTSCAVSESFYKKYFDDANPIGEIISINDKAYKITLVFADLPENTSLKYDILLAYDLSDAETSWMDFSSRTYLLMPQGYKAQDFQPIADSIYSRYLAKEGLPLPEKYWLQPLSDIHFNSDISGEIIGNKFYIYGFTGIAIFILLVACINYMNLATARATKRAKEVGIRKILGTGRLGLRLQFLGEAVFFSLIALFFGLVLVEIALNLTPLNALLNKYITLNFSREPSLILWVLAFSLGIGLMAGSYPALYLSSIPVLSALKSGHRVGRGGIRFRQVLVLIQFTITVSVIACVLIMALQMRYVSRTPLGFEKENRILITLGWDVINQVPTIKNELSKNSSILGITQSSAIFIQPGHVTYPEDGVQKTVAGYSVEDNFIEVMGMQLVTGRDFSKRLLSDVGYSIIVNEAMVKAEGWDEPLGQSLRFGKVIGVVKDFHFASLHSPVGPLMLQRSGSGRTPVSGKTPNLILHISDKNIPNTLAFLKKKVAEFDPKHPFEYEFLDDHLDKLYMSEHRLMKLIAIFGGVCILISCMGLFGLSAFTTEQRTKEIGIRKVFCASTWQIIGMLFKNILLLVLGGALIASLVAYYAMDEWLTSFAYKTGINPLVFLVSAGVAAGVAFITVVLQSYKTARANPVEALRYE